MMYRWFLVIVGALLCVNVASATLVVTGISPPSIYPNSTQYGCGVATNRDGTLAVAVGFDYTTFTAYATLLTRQYNGTFEMTQVLIGNVIPDFVNFFGPGSVQQQRCPAFFSADSRILIWGWGNYGNYGTGELYVFYVNDTTNSYDRSQVITEPDYSPNRMFATAAIMDTAGTKMMIAATAIVTTDPNVLYLFENTAYPPVFNVIANFTHPFCGSCSGSVGDLFGFTLAGNENLTVIAIGAWFDNVFYHGHGAVHMYTWPNTSVLPSQVDFLNGSDVSNTPHRFGYSLAMSEDGLVLYVGTFQAPGSSFVGNATRYEINPDGTLANYTGIALDIKQTSYVTSSTTGQGASVATTRDGAIGIVGAPYDFNGDGAIYVWEKVAPGVCVVTDRLAILPTLPGNSSLVVNNGWGASDISRTDAGGCGFTIIGGGLSDVVTWQVGPPYGGEGWVYVYTTCIGLTPPVAPVPPPTAPPTESPIAAPLAPPVEPPVEAPVEAPISPPALDPPIDAPVAAPIAPPVDSPVASVPVSPPVDAPTAPPPPTDPDSDEPHGHRHYHIVIDIDETEVDDDDDTFTPAPVSDYDLDDDDDGISITIALE